MRRIHLLLFLLAVLIGAFAPEPTLNRGLTRMIQRVRGRKTVGDRVREYGAAARARLAPHFSRAGVPYPPARLVLLGLKEEKELQAYAGGEGALHFIRAYPVLGASGGPGPKLREGDGQVPEGVYLIESLNANSLYHLSLRIGYPNAYDREMAAREGRHELGSDIMVHGGTGSIGCLAMGDEAAEDLFVLAADVGVEGIRLILAPRDLRRRRIPAALPGAPAWVAGLYARLAEEMQALPVAPAGPS